MERRRRRAGQLFSEGKTQAEVARKLDVSRQSVSRWHKQFKSGGADALRGAGRAGRKPRLSQDRLRSLDKTLRTGARANGYATDLWTLPRVAAVIERECGISYHPGHVWKILGALGWTLQRPAKQAKERNAHARREWIVKRWPEIKKKPAD